MKRCSSPFHPLLPLLLQDAVRMTSGLRSSRRNRTIRVKLLISYTARIHGEPCPMRKKEARRSAALPRTKTAEGTSEMPDEIAS